MTYLRIFGAICALLAVFLFGMWLTWPELAYNPSGFPIDRKFVAVSLNGQPLVQRFSRRVPEFEVRGRSTFYHRVGGTTLCNYWGGRVTFLPFKRIIWREVHQTAVGCDPPELEEKYLRVLPSASRWRREEGDLILDNGTDILRFQLAPP